MVSSRLSALASAGLATALLTAATVAQSNDWAKMPRMELERQFAGPLQDTVIQRWRDPIDGSICYIYLPITAAHSSPTPSGYVQYGPNQIGSLSCVVGNGNPSSLPKGTPQRPSAPKPQ